VRQFAAGLVFAVATSAAAFQGTVVRVIDGDTIRVEPLGAARRPVVVRLQGIDAPERCQRGGEAARAALAARVLGRPVEVRVRARDAYRRAIGRVVADGEDVNRWLVERGHAWSPGWHHRPGPYAIEERAARAAKRGLFARDDAIEPWRFRRMHGSCER
jgi:endonuclease YncB( thermonuclease family)